MSTSRTNEERMAVRASILASRSVISAAARVRAVEHDSGPPEARCSSTSMSARTEPTSRPRLSQSVPGWPRSQASRRSTGSFASSATSAISTGRPSAISRCKGPMDPAMSPWRSNPAKFSRRLSISDTSSTLVCECVFSLRPVPAYRVKRAADPNRTDAMRSTALRTRTGAQNPSGVLCRHPVGAGASLGERHPDPAGAFEGCTSVS